MGEGVRYLSVCSGIEAASAAWHRLGWSPVGFAEIEAFPSAVLAHHYGSNLPGTPLASNGVPNFGDINNFRDWPDAAFDVLVGGTPCQSFSVAGLRKGLADPRGNLALVYLGIADRYRPEWIVWENVPGVLSSSGGRDFGAFIGGLAELGYHAAWRVLDAQYVRVDGFGRAVPQRRRRVFVVGHLGDWRRAAAVLFEPESLSGDSPPRREARQGVARPIGAGSPRGSGYRNDADTVENLVAHTLSAARGAANAHAADLETYIPVASLCLNAGGMGRQDYETETETVIAHALRGEGFDASEDGTGRATLVPTIAQTLTRGAESSGKGGYAVRRLTPTECERLQGFPDGYTAIPHRGKPAADGPRYKALGNSMAVNVMRWIGHRIDMVSALSPRLNQREEDPNG